MLRGTNALCSLNKLSFLMARTCKPYAKKYIAWGCFCLSRTKYMPWLSYLCSRTHLLDTAFIPLPLMGWKPGHRGWRDLVSRMCSAWLRIRFRHKLPLEALGKSGKHVICTATSRWWFITPLLSIRLVLHLIKAPWENRTTSFVCWLQMICKGIKWAFLIICCINALINSEKTKPHKDNEINFSL